MASVNAKVPGVSSDSLPICTIYILDSHSSSLSFSATGAGLASVVSGMSAGGRQ